ncbi:MAG: ribosomal protein S5 domain 2-type protein [Linnemannia gamsii]|nr:MAG: ribosomal protein S5 domain 2-type protein [Linnemannia gamsii]
MDDLTPLQEEALAIVSIYGPAAFYALPTGNKCNVSKNNNAVEEAPTPVYTLKVSLEEPDFDYDPTTASLSEDLSRTTISAGGSNHNHKKTSTKELEFRIYFPTGYPETNTTSPVHEIVSIYYGTLRLTNTMLQEIDQGLEDCFVPGEVVVFSWIEWLRTYLEELETRDVLEDEQNEEEEDEEEVGDYDIEDDPSSHVSEGQRGASDYYLADDASSGRHPHHSSSSNNPTDVTSPRLNGPPSGSIFQIRTGAPIVDRKSVFVAHLAAIRQPGEVPWMIQQLKQENKKVIKATHNIMAFRVENENGTITQDNDDDGETAAGSRLLHLMSILDVKNVVVVVSRWYGGIPLSADRFKHINNAARLLLDECGYIPTPGTDDAASAASGKKKGSKPNKKAGKR